MNALYSSNINLKINKYFEIAYIFKNKHYFKKCLKCEKKINKIVKDTYGDKHFLFGKVNKELGITLYNLKKPNEAIEKLTIALDIFLNTSNDDYEKDIYEINYTLYKCFYDTQDYHNLINYGINTCQYKHIDDIDKTFIYSKISRFNYMLYLSEKKLAYLIRALAFNYESQNLFIKTNNTSLDEYVYTIFDCADIYNSLEDYENAIDFYEQAEKLTIERDLSNDLLFNIYNNLLYIYKEKGYHDTYRYYFNKIKHV